MGNLYEISTEKKVNMIFAYLFDDKKSEEEEFFWNNLKPEEVSEIKSIELEEKFDFNILKSQILGD